MTFLSFGGGVQSCAMLHFIRDGVIERPDVIIFADTGAEMPETYHTIDELVVPFCEELSIPFIICQSTLRGRIQDWHMEHNAIPMIGFKSCTGNWKIRVIRRIMREYVGNGRGKPLVKVQLGITTDESRRANASDVKWAVNSFPLIEAGISREDCEDRLVEAGWSVRKSGCSFCPYQGSESWNYLKDNHPVLFQEAIDLEENYRANRPGRRQGLLNKAGKWLIDGIPEKKESECDSGGCFL